ncbi:MAG: FkbM family methyltransferase [Thiohalocapsa sp.]
MVEMVNVKGLWVPVWEENRFAEYPEFEGAPNLDVQKTSIAMSHCRSRRVAIDVGAHIGATARYLSGCFEQVIALEAVPETFEVLLRNVSHLKNVKTLNLAASSASCELYFESLRTHSQIARVLLEDESLAFGEESSRVGPVKAIPLDSLGLEDVDFIKIDVEGWELDVVKGAEDTIRRCHPVILIEQGGNETKYHGRPRDEASRALEALGMRSVPGFKFKIDRVFVFPPG